jgi:hypothetical protein
VASACALIALVGSSAASAAIVSGSGSGAIFAKLFPADTPPAIFQVGNDNWNVDGVFWGFDEKSVTLAAPLNVFSSTGGAAKVLAAGTRVQSHYVFYDPVAGSFSGTVLFDKPILGVIWSTADMAVTDPVFGLKGVGYNSVAATGLEPTDLFSFSGSTLSVNWSASNPGDFVRVLTAIPTAVPEPSSYAAMLMGVAMLGTVAYRRSKSL